MPFAAAAAFLVLIAVATPGVVGALRRRRLRRASWSARALHRLERVGRKAGRVRAPAETPREYARVLAERLGDERLLGVGDTLDAGPVLGRRRARDGSSGRRRGANLALTVKGIL